VAKIGFILNRSPFSGEHLETLYRLANAAIKKEHSVFIFLNQDGVLGPIRNQGSSGAGKTPGQILDELMKKGANVFCSSLDVKRRGLDSSKSFLNEVKNGELPIGTLDRLISL